MSRWLRYTFVVHAIVALVAGAGLLAAPGRFLGLFGWAPVDPLLSRVLGAALVALAWSSYRAFRGLERGQVAASELRLLLEVEALFCLLACAGMVRHMWGSGWPWYVWMLLSVLAAFAFAWIGALVWQRRSTTASFVDRAQ